jgi:pantoate--beta-alanine ligase
MIVYKYAKDLEKQLLRLKKQGKNIAFIPTMGALHKGHISLIKAGKKGNTVAVCSIFINPTQFNDKADFDKYPVTIEADIDQLNDAGCDILFVPSVKEMYPNGLKNMRPINFGFLAQTLEGEHRPGHFNGMAQIVERLLRIVKPHTLLMGQKDYQQQLIVKELIKKRKLNTLLITCPTLREADGLAMSSRNVRLDKDARATAVEISKTLKAVKAALRKPKSTAAEVQHWALQHLQGIKGVSPEYFEIRNANTLAPPKRKTEKLVALTAVNIGGVRLIDNMVL